MNHYDPPQPTEIEVLESGIASAAGFLAQSRYWPDRNAERTTKRRAALRKLCAEYLAALDREPADEEQTSP